MREYLKGYVEENYKVIKIIGMCFLIGLIVGIIFFGFINDGIKNEFIGSLKNTINLSKNNNFESINVIKNGIVANFILLFIIYFCAITLLAPILICMVTFFKSFSIGLYIPIIFNVFGVSKGIIVTILLVVLPNLLYIPAFLFSCTNAIKFHYLLFEKKESGFLLSIMRELIYVFITFSIIILSVVVEQLVSLNVLNM